MTAKKAVCIILFLSNLVLSGCQKNIFPASFEIDQIDVVQVVGADRCEDDPSLVEVTFMSAAQRKTATETGGGGALVVSIVSEKGTTVFDAKRKLKAHSDKVTLLGHVDYFIFGEDAAEEDFVKYLDCFTRDNEIRFTPKLYVAKGCSAKELMQRSSTGDKFLADRLKNFDYDVKLMSNFEQVKLIEVAGMIDNRTAATIIPALACRDIEDEVFTGEMPETDVVTGGYAVIKNFKLAGFLEDSAARGYNFLTNNVISSNVTVKDSAEMYVDLEVTSAETTVEMTFEGDTLKGVKYKTAVKGTIREVQSRENIFTTASIKALEDQLSGILRDEMMQTINTSREFGTDCIKLGQKINMKHPVRWEKLKGNWSETFMNLNIEVEVASQIRRTLSIEKPNGYQEES